MIGGRPLKTKALQTTVEHRREVSRLGVAQTMAREARVAHRVSEERFWKEVSRAASERSRGSGEHHAVSLDRAREAGRLMSMATSHRKRTEQEVISRVGSVLRTEVAVKLVASMQRKEERRRAAKLEEHRGEEIQELAGIRPILEFGVDARRESHKQLPLESRRGSLCERSISSVSASNDHSATGHLNLSPQREPLTKGVSVECSSLKPHTVVHSAGLECVEGARELRIACESGGAQVTCRVVDHPGNEVGIVLESCASDISSMSPTAKVALTSRLRALGINVHRLDVKPDIHRTQLDTRPRRRGSLYTEEGDENGIT